MEQSYRFFENRACAYFPCHDLSGDFNCLFCYCPFYTRPVCPGNPTFITKEDGRTIKRCTDCAFPHKPEHYEQIMALLRQGAPDFASGEYHHGGETTDTHLARADFSVNTNPLGMSESVKRALIDAVDSFERYPDQNCTALRALLSQKLGVDGRELFFGNGASEVISLIVQALKPKRALLIAPAFSGYERALRTNGSEIHYHFLKRAQNFALDETIFDTLVRVKADILFLCTPNNPTGARIDDNLLEKIAAYCEEQGVSLVVDECFLDFIPDAKSTMRLTHKKLITLNAFTKTYALAGLRLGYARIRSDALLARMNALRPEWNISNAAQIAGVVALNERGYLEKTQRLIATERKFLEEKLKALGFHVISGEANFLLITENDKIDSKKSEKIDMLLQKQGIFVRNCASFPGLTARDIRIAIKSHEDNCLLVNSLTEILHS